MPKSYTFNGTTYIFPDEMSDQEIQQAAVKNGIVKPGDTGFTETPRSFKSKALEFARPIADTAAGAAGAALSGGVPFVGAVAGPAAYLGMDQIMQALQGSERQPSISSNVLDLQKGGVADRVASTAEQYGMNAALGKILTPLASGIKGVINEGLYGGVANPLLGELGATYSQYQNRPIAELIENIAARGYKAKALEAISAKASDMAGKIGKVFSPIRVASEVQDPQLLGNYIQQQTAQVFDESLKESGARAQIAKSVAQLNPEKVITGMKAVSTGGYGPPAIVPQVEIVRGPVKLDNVIMWAKNYIEGKSRAIFQPDEEKLLVQEAQNILKATNAQFDTAGKLVNSRPVSFEEAWDLKKALGDVGYGKPKEGITKVNSFFQDAERNITDDITSSVGKWRNGRQQALDAWNEARTIVAKRHELFHQADQIPTLLNTTNSPISAVNAIVDDPKKLERALNIASLGDATKALSKFNVTNFASNNLKQDLKSYQFMRMMRNAYEQPAGANQDTGRYVKSKLMDQINDPEVQQSLSKLYSGRELDNIKQFFRAVGDTGIPASGAGNIAAKIRVLGATAVLGSGLVGSMLSGSALNAGTAASGVILGGYLTLQQVGKILTKPDAAKYLTAFVEGTPLGTSEKYAMKTITSALTGTILDVKMDNNRIVHLKVLPGGEFKEVKE